jgi:predicted ester cyclase
MSVKQNKASIIRSTEELWNKRDLSVVDDLISSDFIFHAIMEVKGPEGYRQYINMMCSAFPDWHETITHLVAEGDLVAAYYSIHGTFKGAIMGMNPTGKSFTIQTAVLWRFTRGKLVEAWAYSDSLSLFRQIGVNPPQA